jgi:acyl-CoA thioesterase-2
VENHPSLVRLLDMLDLERLDRDLYRAKATPESEAHGRLFGGQVAAQALRAATLTVEVDHHCHSLHGYFLRPGRPGLPLLLHVERIRDGRSFSTRRITVRQEGEAIFNLSASFQKREAGHEYEVTIAPDVPGPTDEEFDWPSSQFSEFAARMPFEMRDIGPTPADEHGQVASTRRAWMRAKGGLPDDSDLHLCLATFISDMGAVFAAALSVVSNPMELMGASLDHAMWFHRPLKVDDWFLYDLSPISSQAGRGLVKGAMYAADGSHAVSVTQEALIRPVKNRG